MMLASFGREVGGHMVAASTGLIVGLIILLVILAIAFFVVLGRARRP